ncbi:MAG: sulfotransferase [Gammaproteobacteria bacterium]
MREVVPAERLLVFEATQGWAPLCAFLNVPVPDEPYPRVNSTEEFLARRPGP